VLWSISGKLPFDNAQTRELHRLGRAMQRRLCREEGWKGAIRYQSSVDVRYRGQGHELNIRYSRRMVVTSAANTSAAMVTATPSVESNW